MPTTPDHPGRAPPNIPIPGEPTVGSQEEFRCKKCGKVFNSKDELKVHLSIEHPSNKEKKRRLT